MCVDDIMTSRETEDEPPDQLRELLGKAASKYDVDFRASYGEGEYYNKMDQAKRR